MFFVKGYANDDQEDRHGDVQEERGNADFPAGPVEKNVACLDDYERHAPSRAGPVQVAQVVT